MTRIVTIDLPNESVDFDLAEVSVQHKPEGVAIRPKPGKQIGYSTLFFPWGEIRRIKEYVKS